MLKARVTIRVMKLGRYVTVDDGGNYVTERSHKDKKNNNNNSSQRELGPPVVTQREKNTFAFAESRIVIELNEIWNGHNIDDKRTVEQYTTFTVYLGHTACLVWRMICVWNL